jgi:hypothetical protein
MKKEIGSGSIRQRYGSGDPDHTNVTNPQHWIKLGRGVAMLGNMVTKLRKRVAKLGRCVLKQVQRLAKQRVGMARLRVGCIS